jgi:hypothetical protein
MTKSAWSDGSKFGYRRVSVFLGINVILSNMGDTTFSIMKILLMFDEDGPNLCFFVLGKRPMMRAAAAEIAVHEASEVGLVQLDGSMRRAAVFTG